MRVLAALALLLTLCFPASAQFVGSHDLGTPGFNIPAATGGGGGSATMAFVTSANDTVGGTTISYGTVNIGATAANRVTPIAIAFRDSAGTGVTSVSVNGHAATQVSGAARTSSSMSTDVWYITDATCLCSGATSATISVTYGGSLRSVIATYTMTTATPTPSTSTNQAVATTCQTVTFPAVTIPTNGVALAVVANRSNTGNSPVWSGATTTTDWTQTFTATHDTTGAHDSTLTGSQTFAVTWSPGSGSDCEGSVAVWGP